MYKRQGVYWFSYAVTPEDARLEARACRDVLAPYWGKLTYPVYHDYEYDTERYVKEKTGRDPTRAERTAVIAAFLQEIESFGYRGGVYTNRDYMKNRLDMNALAPYELWAVSYTHLDVYKRQCATCVQAQPGRRGRGGGRRGR